MSERKNKKPEFHGSDLELIEAHYKIPKEEITNFGANVNPLGVPASAVNALKSNLALISAYPDRKYTGLRRAISDYCGAQTEHILVGNGVTELISLTVQQIRPKKAVLLGPTYSEYERELALAGGALSYITLDERADFRLDTGAFLGTLAEAPDTDMLILCNPNNPTSSAVRTEELRAILSYCEKNHIFVMVDETYIEFAEDIGAISAIPLTEVFDNLIVLRGVSKFFASPGLRLGYGITGSRSLMQGLLALQNPWSLNTLGAFAGEQLFRDEEYIRRTRDFISQERDRILEALEGIDTVHVYPPSANFLLVRLLRDGLSSADVFEHAIRQRLMIRDCSSFEQLDGEFIRFCIMNREDNDRLLACLREIL